MGADRNNSQALLTATTNNTRKKFMMFMLKIARMSEYFFNCTSAHYRLFSAINGERKMGRQHSGVKKNSNEMPISTEGLL